MIELQPFDPASFPRLISWVDSPDALFSWAGDSFAYPLDRRQLERHLAESGEAEEPYRLPFGAMHPGGADPLAYVELCQIDRRHRTATVCRLLVAPDARRRSVGAGTMRAALAIGFDKLGLHRIDLRVFEGNVAAVRLHERLGFTKEGVMRDVRRDHAGRHRSTIVMSMLEGEWAQARGACS